MSRKMLINALEPEESRIAVVEDGVLEEFYLERASHETLVGNVYKGKVVNVLPSLRAAFVDIGLKNKNGFLHASDIVGTLEQNGSGILGEEAIEDALDRKGRDEPAVQSLLAIGQEVLVQVTRDGMGEKGPSLTMDISLPGRYLVITPRVRRVAVSKRIADPSERDALRALLDELDPPRTLGFIIRTAGQERSTRDLKRDLDYLQRLWKAVVVRAQNTRAPAPVFQESDLVIRTIRDIFTTDIDELVIDSFSVYNRTLEFFQAAMPQYQDHVKYYRDSEPLFFHFDVERQIEMIYQRTVPLPSGGSIVIDQTEALTAIDVNSGKFTKTNSPEEMAYRTNMEAAAEVVRQLRLRDLGGQIIVDFIDLREEKNRNAVERVLRDAARKDRSQSTILRMSRLGLVEMARQKVRPGVKLMAYEMCQHCQGTGYTKNVESMSLQALRQLRQVLGKNGSFVEMRVHPEVAHYLQNVKRRELISLEDRHHKTVLVRSVPTFRLTDTEFQSQEEVRSNGRNEAPLAAAGTAAPAQQDQRRRESGLRRSVLAAAQESRLAAQGAETRTDEPLPIEPRTADAEAAAASRAPIPPGRGGRRPMQPPITPLSVPQDGGAPPTEGVGALAPVAEVAGVASPAAAGAPAPEAPTEPKPVKRRSYGQLMHPIARRGASIAKALSPAHRPPVRAPIPKTSAPAPTTGGPEPGIGATADESAVPVPAAPPPSAVESSPPTEPQSAPAPEQQEPPTTTVREPLAPAAEEESAADARAETTEPTSAEEAEAEAPASKPATRSRPRGGRKSAPKSEPTEESAESEAGEPEAKRGARRAAAPKRKTAPASGGTRRRKATEGRGEK